MQSPSSQTVSRMFSTSNTATPIRVGGEGMANTRTSPFMNKTKQSGSGNHTRYASSSGSSHNSRNNSPMRKTQTSIVSSMIQSATMSKKKDTAVRDASKGEFLKYLDDRASQGHKKSKKRIWKKFLNVRAGIVEQEIGGKKLPPIRIDNK